MNTAVIRNREELHEALCSILGSRHVYFQPPETVRMVYPAIVYERSDIRPYHADNGVYNHTHHYSLTVIDPDPDSKIVEHVANLPKCRFNRHFATEGLNHDIFTIFY